MAVPVTIKLLGPSDEALVVSATGLFDDPPIAEQTHAFLSSERDFLWFALADGRPVGFVSASVLLHPDKPPHLFINELATAEGHRRRGIATHLMTAVAAFGRERSLWPIWVAAEGDDQPAQAFYRSLSDMTERGAVVFEWD
jgi:ribosomal protein S18 acetylase RimI-like enzyme